MKKKITFILLLTVLLAASEMVQAHPGHGNDNPLSPGHYVTNQEHAIPLTLLIAVVVVAVNWLVSKIEWRVKKN